MYILDYNKMLAEVTAMAEESNNDYLVEMFKDYEEKALFDACDSFCPDGVYTSDEGEIVRGDRTDEQMKSLLEANNYDPDLNHDNVQEFFDMLNERHREIVRQWVDNVAEELGEEAYGVEYTPKTSTLTFNVLGEQHTISGEFFIDKQGYLHHTHVMPISGREIDVQCLVRPDDAEAAGVVPCSAYTQGGDWVLNISGHTKRLHYSIRTRADVARYVAELAEDNHTDYRLEF